VSAAVGLTVGAVVLAGGTGRRLGGIDKAEIEVGGRSLLEHVLSAVPAEVSVVVVGPQRATSRRVSWCREEPAGGGPLAAVAAGVRQLSTDLALLLTCDAPLVGDVSERLLDAARGAVEAGRDGVGTVLPSGVTPPLPVCVSRTALLAVLPGTVDNGRLWPVIEALDLDRQTVSEDSVWDIDTVADLEYVQRLFNASEEQA
jgi:molybdopterin-guanine dinucleotide biosynthesis protein A